MTSHPSKRVALEEVKEESKRLAKRAKHVEEDTEVIHQVKEKQRKIDIAEVFSRPRVTEAAKKFGLSVGEAIDIATGWDLSRKRDRRRCLKWIRQNKPQVIMISPPCTAFCRLQGLSKWSANKERTLWTGVQFLKFAAAVAKEQVREERHFLFEHPASATSWSRPEMRSLRRLPGVVQVVGDLCMFGLTTRSATGQARPAKKRTKFMTNIPEVTKELGVRCDGRHEHQALISGRARKAEVYPQELCKAICRSVVGLKARLENDFERVLEDEGSTCGRTRLTHHSFQKQLDGLAISISELGRLPRQREAEHAQAGAVMNNCRKRREMLSAEKQRALENLPHWTWRAEATDEFNAAWWDQLAAVEEYLAQHGNLPKQRNPLGTWVNNMRKPDRRRRLSPEQLGALKRCKIIAMDEN